MKFERVTQWAELSDCKRYSVAASKVMGKYKFQAFADPGSGKPWDLLGTKDSAESARQLCRDHSLQRDAA